ncbi:hypothetical protein Pla175_37810 [Pirellulimonas nuda]|uniref:Uncharacterized protein n=1 Tax=Pirellulimonas nuda TaxID=2528009 RepID=A0A518DFW7_9BACT|nr:hypothetical protein [Pirellulimonas nuda]QDU90377.1 hypothetical protein Pla175_37810 [Pirellulimonas nuda]
MQTHPTTGAAASAQQQKKLALVGLLALTLVGVVVYQVGSGADEQEPTTLAAAPQPAARVATPVAPAAVAPSTKPEPPQRRLPEISIAQIIAENPFGASDAKPQANLLAAALAGGAQPRPSAATPRRDAPDRPVPSAEAPLLVQAIIHNAAQQVALVDNQLVGVNDVVHDRWRIVSVGAEGIVVEPVGASAGR